MNQNKTITSKIQLLAELAGSLSTPEKWKEKDINVIIKNAKASHFRNKKP